MKRLAPLLLLVLPAFAFAGENEAIALALNDIQSLPGSQRHHIRYVWLQDGSKEAMQATSLALNYISRASVIVRPLPVDRTLLRVDLRHYAPQPKDLQEFKEAWFNFSFDPRFSLLLTKDTLAFYRSIGLAAKVTEIEGDVVRVPSPHLDQLTFAALVTETGSQAPIVESRYFLARALAAIRDKGAYQTIYGGLYYDFAGIPANSKKGTDEDNLFDQLGVGDVKNGITAEKIFDRLRSDQRVAVFRSNITARPRRADFLRTLAGRDSQSILSVTHDIRQQDIDIGTHPVANLLNFKDFARETIFEKPNGLHGFALFDGNGKRTDEAPPDVAIDHLVPAPHPTRLQPAIGCIRCHGSEGGWRVVQNDAKKLLGALFDVFPARRTDDIDRLAGLYAGDVERKLLPRGRDDYAGAILSATGPWTKGKKDQTQIVTVSSGYLADTWRAYWYDTIDARRALIELGVKVDPKADAPKKLRELLPPVNLVIDGRVPEDPRIAALLVGLSIGRTDFDLVYGFLATRIGAKK